MPGAKQMGSHVRALRRREGLSQAELARRLGISASYLNMIERNKRPLSAPLLLELARLFPIDLQDFARDEPERLLADLMECFGDPLFDSQELVNVEVRELAETHPTVAKAVLELYRGYRDARQRNEDLAARFADVGDTGAGATPSLPGEEVHDFIQRRGNHFPELEEHAEELWGEAQLEEHDLSPGLAAWLAREHGIEVEIRRVDEMKGALRHFDRRRKRLYLSEVLRRGSRNFNLAYVCGLLGQGGVLERYADDASLTTPESRRTCRIALANYYASAVLMPYGPFLQAANETRYDIELLGHRFRTSFEQVCHRLATLRRPGAEGVPFHVLRTDIAGNISKRFSASGMHFARFSGACSRWTVFSAFLTPGRWRVALARTPDGQTWFEVARTVQKESRGYLGRPPIHAIGLGCKVEHARALVYSDGVDLQHLEAAKPIGITCRLCERLDCEERAFPPVSVPMQVDENVRGISFYAPPHEA